MPPLHLILSCEAMASLHNLSALLRRPILPGLAGPLRGRSPLRQTCRSAAFFIVDVRDMSIGSGIMVMASRDIHNLCTAACGVSTVALADASWLSRDGSSLASTAAHNSYVSNRPLEEG